MFLEFEISPFKMEKNFENVDRRYLLNCENGFWNVRLLFWNVGPLFWNVRPVFWNVSPVFLKCDIGLLILWPTLISPFLIQNFAKVWSSTFLNVRPVFWNVRPVFWKVRSLFWKVRLVFYEKSFFRYHCWHYIVAYIKRDHTCFLILLSTVSVLLHTSHWHHNVAYITMDRICFFILLSSVSVLLHTSHWHHIVVYITLTS